MNHSRSMDLFDTVTLLSAVGCGLIAGVFFAFSTSVMRALATLPDLHGITAMQSVNVFILNPLFLGAFLGTAIASMFAIVLALLDRGHAGSAWAIAGGLLYLAGSFFVTMRFNVPLNDRLARAPSESPEAAALWRKYLLIWTRWNHVRSAASLAGAASFTLSGFVG